MVYPVLQENSLVTNRLTITVHGGRSVVRVAHKHQDKRNRWIGDLKQRRGENISNVAVANKNTRIAWALLTRKENYKTA
jgi:transposase